MIIKERMILNNLVGKSAPDFTLESYNGDKMTLSSLKGVIRYVKDDVQMAVRNQELIAEIDKL